MNVRTTLVLSAAATAALTMSSCNSGPKQLTRTWDTWVNQKYADDAYVHGLILQDLVPVYTFVGFFALMGDWLFLNPYYFWSEDVWDGRGTAYDYEDADGAKRSVESLLDDVE